MTSQAKQKLVARIQRQTQVEQSQLVSKFFSNYTNQLVVVISELNKRGKLHGIDHFVTKSYHPLERFLWLILVIAAFYGVFYVGNSQMIRFRANPTVISLERGTFTVL